MEVVAKRIPRVLAVILLAAAMLITSLPMLAGEVYAAGTTNVTVGSGTDKTSFNPYNNDWTYGRTQQIYKASDIGRSGTIQSIGFDVATTASSYKVTGMEIWMGYTHLDTYDTSKNLTVSASEYTLGQDDLTKVYSGTPQLGAEQGWETITLDKPFEYDAGQGNLVIATYVKRSAYDSSLKYYCTANGTTTGDKVPAIYAGNLRSADIADITKTTSDSWKFNGGLANLRIGFESSGDEEYFTVSFDADGGEPSPEAQSVLSGGKAVKPEDPSKDGFEFEGWYNGDEAYDFDAPVTSSLELKAKWTEKEVDAGVLKLRFVDENGDPVSGITPKFTAYKTGTDEEIESLNIPADGDQIESSGEGGEVSFDLLDEGNSPFYRFAISDEIEEDDEGNVFVDYVIDADSDAYTCESPVKVTLKCYYDETWNSHVAVDKVGTEAYTGLVKIGLKAEEPPAPSTNVKKGDLVDAGKLDAEGYTGVPRWRVIDVKEDSVLLLSENLWKGNGSDPNATVSFGNTDNKDEAADWNNTTASAWCDGFENAVLKDVDGLDIQNFSSTDPEYTYTKETLKYVFRSAYVYDKVLFLSAEEADTLITDPAQRTASMPGSEEALQWLLRSTETSGGHRYAGAVQPDGGLTAIRARDARAVRPAFWAKVDEKKFTATDESGSTVWAAKDSVSKTALKTAICSAEMDKDSVPASDDGKEIFAGKQYVTTEASETFKVAIADAKAVISSDEADQAEVDAAVTALSSAQEVFDNAKITASVDKTELTEAIGKAETAIEGVAVSEDGIKDDEGNDLAEGKEYVTPADKQAFSSAISSASSIAGREDKYLNQKMIDEAKTSLETAAETFENAKKKAGEVVEADKTALQAAISAATSDMNSTTVSEDGSGLEDGTEYVTVSDRSALKEAIDKAQEIFDKADASQAEVDGAVSDLNEAKKVFDAAKQTAGGSAPAPVASGLKVKTDKDPCKGFPVTEVPWSFSEYQNDHIPPIYIVRSKPSDSIVIDDKGFTVSGEHKYLVAGSVAMDMSTPYWPEQCGGGNVVTTLDYGDPDEMTGIAGTVDDWAYSQMMGLLPADLELPDAQALTDKLAPYALNNDPASTNAGIVWVYGAGTAERAAQGVTNYILVDIRDFDAESVEDHDWGETPVWEWTGNDADGYTAAKATFTCTNCSKTTTEEAKISTKTEGGNKVYTATIELGGMTYTDSKSVKASEEPQQDDADAKAKKVKTVTVNAATVNAKAVDKAVKKAGGSPKYVTKIILGKKVKKVSAKTFAKYKKVTTIELKTKKLSKKSVKSSLKSSKVKTVRVKVGSKKVNKKYVKKYKKIFTKKIAGRKVRVR